MDKPYVICHMMSSVDGRTLTAHWGKPQGMDLYEKTGTKHEADAWICGRVTMEKDFAGDKKLKLSPAPKTVNREDFIAKTNSKSYAIAVDQDGKLNWQKAEIDGDHIISVLTEQVPDDYLHHLQETGISYIFGGEKELDLKLVLQKLYHLFFIKKLLLEGGGHLNGSFLDAGLIDELSFLQLPIADGTPKTPSLFEVSSPKEKFAAKKLKLMEVQQLEHDVLWMRYKVL